MEKVLVTGGCGLIGQHICSGLLKKGFEVIAIDREESGYNEGKLHYSSVICSPTDKNAIAEVFEKNKINIVILAACTVDNDLGPIVTEEQMQESASVDKFIFRYAFTDENVKMVMLLSTDQVYQFPKSREPIREDSDLKPVTNYAVMKYKSEKEIVSEVSRHKDKICCIIRFSPVYTLNFTDNLIAKITDPKDGSNFVYGQGQYGFQMCCVHNLVDFILCYVKNADSTSYTGIYNVGDRLLTTAADIITFMREKHRLGAVMQKQPAGTFSKLKGIFSANKDEKTNYRYLDLAKIENNNMLDNTKARKLVNFRWDIHNTK
ncbi:NAD-dependent epimerase/dehydratase family protein [Ruminococcus flavefaciens]|uniref:UDP-glucose 4-epimerase n=1 Tax=Ruminococcus flavefaciens TaxID=1265 RepID=A0A1M7M019_RUMFL|nr:NAD(P)-dependent oxidoreductase [Ruminococcus flavefaciens]SHM83461.1 UDP-glucose 4-epimerase [Ruminococcus flavefaciens]